MKNLSRYGIVHLAFLCCFMFRVNAQTLMKEPGHMETTHTADALHPCITEAMYAEMEEEMSRNRKALKLERMSGHAVQSTTLLQWPLEPAPGLSDCGYYNISAFVDQNPASGQVKDWNCGTRTYDGHRGVDIVPWPFIWNKMDSNLVRVTAAAPGIIIAKVDGNPDRICNGVGGGSKSNNYISIEHADGSVALYVHLKTGAFTTKEVGQTVAAGEFLGIVGSAGQSTGVHLHFEIRSDGTFANYIDPFFGSCNNGISASWWVTQKPYEEPALLKLSLHRKWPYMGICPNTKDTLYEADVFDPARETQATFYVCSKDVAPNASWSFKITDAQNQTIESWNYTNNSTPRRTSTLGWNKNLPAKPGIYVFQASFNGTTCSKSFTIASSAGARDPSAIAMRMYPNPTSGTLRFSKSFKKVEVYNGLGLKVAHHTLTDQQISLQGFPDGMYLIKADAYTFKTLKVTD